MKKCNILIVFLLLLLIPTYVNAKNESSIGADGEFPGTITFNNKNTQKGAPDVYHGLDHISSVGPYMVYDITFEGNGKTGSAFCVFPHLGASTKNEVRCGEVTPQNFPRSYYVAYTYWDELKTDHKLADFVVRTAGILDKDAKLSEMREEYCNGVGKDTPECSEGYCSDPVHAKEERCKKWSWGGLTEAQNYLESAFVASWQTRVEGHQLDPAYDPYIFRGNKTDRGYEILKDASTHIKEVKDNWHIDTSASGNIIRNTNKIKYGNLVILEEIESDNPAPLKKVYKVTSRSGENIGELTFKAKKGSVRELVKFNGLEGVIEVWVSNDSDCEAIIEVTKGTQQIVEDDCARYEWREVENGCVKYVEPCEKVDYTYYCGKSICHGSYNKCTPQKETCTKKVCVEKKKPAATPTSNVATENNNYEIVSGPTYETDLSQAYQTTLNPKDINENIALYYCSIGGQLEQSYIVIVDDDSSKDTFSLKLCDECCKEAKEYTEMKVADIHNCCEDGAYSFAAQEQLSTLFCKDVETGADISENCNASDYLDKDHLSANIYCQQYCATSIGYKIPGPTYAHTNGSFKLINKDKDGNLAPWFDEYKRCRTIIRYDKFKENYKSAVENLLKEYNAYQKEESHAQLWELLRDDPTKESIENTVSCYTKQEIEYDTTTTGACNAWRCGYITNDEFDCTASEKDSYPKSKCTGYATSTTHHGPEEVTIYTASQTRKQDVITYKESNKKSSKKYSIYKINEENLGYLPNGDSDHDDGKTYYDINSWNSYANLFNESNGALATAKQEAEAKKSNSCSTGNNCKVNKTYVTCDSVPSKSEDELVDPNKKINDYRTEANKHKSSYKSYVNMINTYQISIEECGGKYDDKGVIDSSLNSIKDRIEITQEPNIDISYTTLAYNGEEHQLVSQVVSVPHINVDSEGNQIPETSEKKCIYEKTSSLQQGAVLPNTSIDPYAYFKYWEPDTYSSKISKKINPMQNYKGDISYKYGGFTGDNGIYYASTKFSTDAVNHMTCRWQSKPDQKYYTIYPNGNILYTMPSCKDLDQEQLDRLGIKCEEKSESVDVEIQKRIDRDGLQYTLHQGIAYQYLTTLTGKYQIYYTINNIDEEHIFENAIHINPGCKFGDNEKDIYGNLINAACIINVAKPSQEVFDCNQYINSSGTSTDTCLYNCYCQFKLNNEIIDPDVQKCFKECKIDPPSTILDYREVDPSEPFPNYGINTKEGYAYNWVVDETGKPVYERLKRDAAADKTYSKDNLTYSFTLTPNHIKQIRAYNKSRIDAGGYKDFAMNCEKGTTEDGREILTNCKSQFLEAISGKRTLDYGGSKTLNFNASNIDLETSRNRSK